MDANRICYKKESQVAYDENSRQSKKERKHWKRQERVREGTARRAHLEDLRDRMVARFNLNAGGHSVPLFHPSAVVFQGSTSKDELYEERTSPQSFKASRGGPAGSQDSTEVDTLVNEPMMVCRFQTFLFTWYPRTNFASQIKS